MPRFRPPNSITASAQNDLLTLDDVRAVIADAVRPGHFFVAPGAHIEAVHRESEEVAWEIYQGRLLDTPLTTRRQSFEVWHVFLAGPEGRSAEPVLSAWLDAPAGCLYVTRSLYCHAWEGYHAGNNVYLSRETRKWVRELVGTIRLDRVADVDELRDELICLIFHAIVGLSRLPLISVESPLPAYSLGELAYVYRPALRSAEARPMQSPTELIEQGLLPGLCWLEKAKLLETLLHATAWERLREASDMFVARWRFLGHADADILTLLRTLFNEVALSPYTDLVDKTLAFLDLLETKQYVTAEAAADFLAHLLRQLGRHLTAYDLVVFHHRGANYPDALFLDAVLQALLKRAEQRPTLFADASRDTEAERRAKRLRRRGLRQAWLPRSRYEGLPVPDAPTSEGENARVLPAPHGHVPEEQIVQVHCRKKRLFADDPLIALLGPAAREVLQLSLADLQHPDELREMGMALFLDRPLGIGKAAMEPDQTLLFSYEAFSRSIAERRLDYLAQELKLLDAATHERLRSNLRDLSVCGIPLALLCAREGPAPVSLHDARRVSEDFLFLRTTRRTLGAFLEQYDCRSAVERCGLDFLADGQRLLMIQGFGSTEAERAALTVFDAEFRPRMQLMIDASQGYESRGGCEFPVAGLKVLNAWDASGNPVTK